MGTKDASEDNIEIRFAASYTQHRGEKEGGTRTLCIRIHASNPPFIGDSATLKRSSSRATISSFSRHPLPPPPPKNTRSLSYNPARKRIKEEQQQQKKKRAFFSVKGKLSLSLSIL